MSMTTLISTLGVSLILLAFLGSSFKKIGQTSLAYWLLNLIGGSLAAIAAALMGSVPFVVLEIVWVGTSLVGLVKWYKSSSPH